jgi:hypothetical protein
VTGVDYPEGFCGILPGMDRPPGNAPPGGAGGFGGPPRGGHGPPPGGLPDGHGGPRMGPPPPKRSNLGLVLGISCGALFLVGILAGAVTFYSVARTAPAQLAALPAPPPSPAPPAGSAPPPAGGKLSAELRDVRTFTSNAGKRLHFVGEIHNTGTEPIEFPTARVTLYDRRKAALGSDLCASAVRVLPPSEKVPCTFTTKRPAAFSTFRAEIAPVRALFKGQLATLRIADTSFKPKRGASPYQVEGRLTNESSFTARSVWAIVSFHGSDGRIVGVSQASVASRDLAQGASSAFSAQILDVADVPSKWQVLAVGYGE